MIKINVGSKNPVKIEAVRETISDYEFMNPSEIFSADVRSEVSDQPKSQEEILLGAMNRARNSFINCHYSFGIESGIYRLENQKNYFDVCFCAIYDGSKFYSGISSGFLVPRKATNLIFQKGLDLAEAINEIGFTDSKNIGNEEGLVGILTNGRVSRKDYTKQAIVMALTSLENSPFYYG